MLKIYHEHDKIDEKLIDKNKICVANNRSKERGFLLNDNRDNPCWFFKYEYEKNDEGLMEGVYKATYTVGAQWIKDDTALVIVPKNTLSQLDFVKMFMTCLKGGIDSHNFSKIYGIDFIGERIETPLAQSILDPLLLCHFLSLVETITKRGLKKGYVHKNENLKKCRGRLDIFKNETKNIMTGRGDRVYCSYSDYSVNVPENKIIKRALLISKNIYQKLNVTDRNMLSGILKKCLFAFDQVDDDIQIRDITNYKNNKLYIEYSEAIRLAKIILHRAGYTLAESYKNEGIIPPFWVDMPTLFEYYLLVLMRSRFGDNILSQDEYEDGYKFQWRPDYLLCDDSCSMIIDAKYIPNLKQSESLSDYVRQLSGYARVTEIRELLNVSDDRTIPCVLAYPPSENDPLYTDDIALDNFDNIELTEDELKQFEVEGLHKFYLLPVKLPMIKR